MLKRALWFLQVAAIAAGPSAVLAQPAGFEQITYQGHLELDGAPQSGAFDFLFEIQSQAGASLWSETHPSVQVRGGAFSVALGATTPFAAGLWANDDLYLVIQVRPSGTSTFTPLSGRQQILSVPHAQRSSSATDYRVSGSLVVESSATVEGDLSVVGQTTTSSQVVSGSQQVAGELQVGGPAALNAGATVQGDVDVSGALVSRGRHDLVTNPTAPVVATTSWEISTSRYRLTIGNDFSGKSYPVPHDILLAYCADEDGCRAKIGMSGWSRPTEAKAMVEYNLFYDAASGHYRIEYFNASSSTEGTDGDSAETNLSCPWTSCCLLDYDYEGAALDDSAQGFFLHWSTSGNNVATKKCILILED